MALRCLSCPLSGRARAHRSQELTAGWSVEAVSYCDIPHDQLFLAVHNMAETWPEGEEYLQPHARQEVLRLEGIQLSTALAQKKAATIWVRSNNSPVLCACFRSHSDACMLNHRTVSGVGRSAASRLGTRQSSESGSCSGSSNRSPAACTRKRA